MMIAISHMIRTLALIVLCGGAFAVLSLIGRNIGRIADVFEKWDRLWEREREQ